ncbi:Tubulin-like protein TubZ [Dirofilaria immitis]
MNSRCNNAHPKLGSMKIGTLSLSRLHFPLALSRLTFVNQLSQRLTDRSATVRLMPMAPFQHLSLHIHHGDPASTLNFFN